MSYQNITYKTLCKVLNSNFFEKGLLAIKGNKCYVLWDKSYFLYIDDDSDFKSK